MARPISQQHPGSPALMRRFIGVGLIIVSVFLLASCGDRQEPERPDKASKTARQPATAETARKPTTPELNQPPQPDNTVISRPAWLPKSWGNRSWLKKLQGHDTCYVVDWEAFLQDPSALELAPNIHRLAPRCPHLTFTDKAVAVLNRFPQITKLTIVGHRYSLTADDIRGMSKLRHLSEIRIWQHVLTDADLAPLGDMPSLKVLSLPRCDKFTGAGLSSLTSIQVLHIDSNSLSDEGLASLRNLHDLRELGLGKFQPTDTTLGYLKGHDNLRSLGLHGDRITDAGLTNFQGMENLEELGLTNLRKITGAGLANFAGLKSLRFLNLQNASIDANGLSHLADLPSLEVLYLGGADIDAKGLSHLARTPHLAKLDLSRTGLDDTAMDAISRIKSLEHLNLCGTSVSDAGIALITEMPNLKEINLACTRITNAAFGHLGKLPALKGLWVYGSRVTVDDNSLFRELPGNKAKVLDWMDIGVGYDPQEGLQQQR